MGELWDIGMDSHPGDVQGVLETDVASFRRLDRGVLERGILVQNPGGGRSTSYRLGEPADVIDGI